MSGACGFSAATPAVPLDQSRSAAALWGQDAWWASQPGVYVPYNGAPVYEHRLPPAETFLWGARGQQFWSVYEIDRQDRLAAFSTRYTPEHPHRCSIASWIAGSISRGAPFFFVSIHSRGKSPYPYLCRNVRWGRNPSIP